MTTNASNAGSNDGDERSDERGDARGTVAKAIDDSLTANCIVEELTFQDSRSEEAGDPSTGASALTSNDTVQDGGAVTVRIYSATTTTGCNLTGEGRDLTGIMVWPATYVLCQHAAFHSFGSTVVELGCGVGMVGAVAMRSQGWTSASASSEVTRLWISTDRDRNALEMCRKNFAANALEQTTESSLDDGFRPHNDPAPNPVYDVQYLSWGDAMSMDAIKQRRSELLPTDDANSSRFDAVVAADIVYPSTCGVVLTAMFDTVDALLRSGGIFWLSFASRDGARTPAKLIDAASDAGFAIDAKPPLSDAERSRLPPLLDARLLMLTRHDDARRRNDALGRVDCHIFPGLQEKLDRLNESSSDEEWVAPYFEDDMSDEDDPSDVGDQQPC